MFCVGNVTVVAFVPNAPWRLRRNPSTLPDPDVAWTQTGPGLWPLAHTPQGFSV